MWTRQRKNIAAQEKQCEEEQQGRSGEVVGAKRLFARHAGGSAFIHDWVGAHWAGLAGGSSLGITGPPQGHSSGCGGCEEYSGQGAQAARGHEPASGALPAQPRMCGAAPISRQRRTVLAVVALIRLVQHPQ